ncbi:hypothetical protein EMCG_09760 [[Emmonsia] crescens]|uniref:F-box domain-containing protein n=1 Tax=[Emmonsia] crescens TaxID=73230 RepID=A0A0G2I0Y2_9EURO|nr:hypothetical protein EMCG_09760 [Emmonsia crescens UAMH 3008]
MSVTLNFKPNRKGWPSYGIPEELFACIAAYVSRQDICNLRLVNKEFAFKLQQVLFHTIVVPFGPTLYSFDETLAEKIDTFEILGSCVSRFGLSFEIDQVNLFDPPKKTYNNAVKTFWGEYEWPKPNYVKYDSLRRIEEVGDQVERMRRAFETLTNVSEFALSFDTGYGWLNPPTLLDETLRFEGKHGVFGARLSQEDIPRQRRPLPSAPREKCVASISSESLKEYLESILPGWAFKKLYPFSYTASEGYSASPRFVARNRQLEIDPTIERGRTYGDDRAKGDCQLYPRNPTREHTEWLLETSWAAQAILGSCICAVIDAEKSFQRVHTLNLSSISSGLLSNFNRSQFFEAFPCLTTIILLVIPDWKESDASWDSQNPIRYVDPSTASTMLTRLLDKVISPLVRLERLTIGYVGGGEHAKGKFCRNQHILPAPITYFAHDAANGRLPESPLTFPHIKKLTFENCWFSPLLLVQFLEASYRTPLECLKFDSCSLTAVPGALPRPYVSNMVHPSCIREEYFLQGPRQGTWSDIINQFTPALSLSEQMASMGLRDSPPPRGNVPFSLKRLEFVSCGYVRLAPFFNQNNLVVPYFPTDQILSVSRLFSTNPAQGFPANILVGPPPHLNPIPLAVLQNGGPGWPNAQNPPAATVPVNPPLGAPPSLVPHPAIMQPVHFATIPPGPPLYTLITQQYPALSGPAPVPPATVQQAGNAITLPPGQHIQAHVTHQNATLAALPPGPIAHVMHVPALQAPAASSEDSSEGHSYIDCRLLGTIVQCIGGDEEQILECAFGMTLGWDDAEKQQEVLDDGFKKGGAGRFSGIIVEPDRGFSERRFSARPFYYWDVPDLRRFLQDE